MKKQHNKTITMILITVVAAVIVGSLYGFVMATQRKINDKVEQSVKEMASFQKNNIYEAFMADLKVLENYASIMSDQEFNYEASIKILSNLETKSNYARIDAFDRNGDTMKQDGTVLNVANRDYFQKAMSGISYISEPIETYIDSQYALVVAAPVFDSSKENVDYVIAGAYYLDDVVRIISNQSNSDYVCSILNSKVEMIAATDMDKDKIAIRKDYVKGFDYVTFVEGSVEKIYNDFSSNSEGLIAYKHNGNIIYSYYLPLGINDWYVSARISKDNIAANVNLTNMDLVRLMCVLIACWLILSVYFKYAREQQQQFIDEKSNFDKLTGLANPERFKVEVNNIIQKHPDTKFSCIVLDIRNFKLINDRFGNEVGDETLLILRDELKNVESGEPKGTVALSKLHTDTFAIFMPTDLFNETGKRITYFINNCNKKIRYMQDYSLNLSIGRYIAVPGDDANIILERAITAHSYSKNSTPNVFFDYDSSFLKRLHKNNDILTSFDEALANNEFTIAIQPQYAANSLKISGAEVLVRWIKDGKVRYSPDEFISVLEQSGKISKLDTYIRDCTCRLIRKWIDEGQQLIPLSVNVSKLELFEDNFVESIVEVTKKYDIPTNMLHIEITETAYADQHLILSNVVKRLNDYGFLVELDDFGSGYSSLNVLKDIPVDILKLDMKFIEGGDYSSKSGGILSSVIRLAQSINLDTIAEGVETIEQVDFLTSIGCNYMQGYYFSKPLPIDEFEKLLNDNSDFIDLKKRNTEKNADIDFFGLTTQEAALFNSYLGGVIIAEYYNNELNTLRVNNKYYDVFATNNVDFSPFGKNIFDFLLPESRDGLKENIERALISGEELSGETCMYPISETDEFTWQQYRLRFLGQRGDRAIFFFALTDITKRKELELQSSKNALELETLQNTIPGMIFYAKHAHGHEVVFGNDRFYKFIGYSKEEFQNQFNSSFEAIVPEEDLAEIKKIAASDLDKGKTVTLNHRIICKGNIIKWVLVNSVIVFDGENRKLLYSMFIDMTKQKELEIKLNNEILKSQLLVESMAGGYAQFELEDGEFKATHISDRLCEMTGYSKDELMKISFRELIHPEDIDDEAVNNAINNNIPCSIKCRLLRKDGTFMWVKNDGRVVTDENNNKIFYGSFYDISDLKALEDTLSMDKNEYERILNSIQGGVITTLVTPEREYIPQFVSTGMIGTLGYCREEVVQMLVTKKFPVHHKDLEELVKSIRNTLDNDVETNTNCRFYDKLGNQVWVHVRVIKFGTIDGMPLFHMMFQNLDTTLELYQTLFDNVLDGISVFDIENDELLFSNKTIDRLIDTTSFEKWVKNNLDVDYQSIKADENLYTEISIDNKRLAITIKPINWNGKNACLMQVNDITAEYIEQESMHNLVSNVPGCIVVGSLINGEYIRTFVSEGTYQLLDIAPNEVIVGVRPGQNHKMNKEDSILLEKLIEQISIDFKPASLDFRYYYDNGDIRWLQLRINAVKEKDDTITYYSSYNDITEQKELEEAIKLNNEELTTYFERLDKYILRYEIKTKTLTMDDEASFVLEIPKKIENALEFLSKNVFREADYETFNAVATFLGDIEHGKPTGACDFKFTDQTGDYNWLHIEYVTVFDSDGQPIRAFMTLRDVTKERDYLFNMEQLARKDGMTNTYNRTTAENLIKTEMEKNSNFTFAMIDLDDLKILNDQYGHHVGDEAIIKTVTILKEHFRNTDIIGRFGGDEFVVFLPNLVDKEILTRHFDELTKILDETEVIEGRTIKCSIGAIINTQPTDFETLYKKADAALYKVKGSGKNNFVIED